MNNDFVNDTPGVITMWSDIGCPWATLALHNLRRYAGETGRPVVVDHRVFPLELLNARATPKIVVDAEAAVLAATEPALGWRPWQRPPHTYPVTTLPALEAVQAAKMPDVGGLAASAELDWALRRAFFVDGRCISLVSEILAIAATCAGLDAEALRASLRRGSQRERIFDDLELARSKAIVGSPHVWLPDGTNLHNPGIEHEAIGRDGSGYLRVVRYEPQVWADLVQLATAARP